MTSHVRVTVPRPPQPTYIPGRCYALKTPDDTSTHCMAKGARLYPVGWRCDDHSPAVIRERQTAPTRTENAA
jgi:hypothetical protein